MAFDPRNPFAGFQLGNALSPEQYRFLADFMANGQANLTANAGQTEAGIFSESYKDPTTGIWFTPESRGTGQPPSFQAYMGGTNPDNHDKSRLNGQMAYFYGGAGAPSGSGTLKGLSKTSEFGPLAQAGAILAAPFAVGGLQAAGLMGGMNPVLAAEAAGAGAGGAAGAAGAAATDFTMGGSAGAFTPATAAEMSAMGVGAGGAGGAAGAGASGVADFTMGGAGGGADTPATAGEMAAMGVGAGGAASSLIPPAAAAASGGFKWGDLIGPAAQLAGGAIGAKAAGDASDAMLQATREAQALQEPFRQGGMAGMNRLLDLLGLSQNTTSAGYGSLMKDPTLADFQADPGYQFRQQEGERGLQRAASASGGLGSGKFLKDAMRFNQGNASQEYGNWFNRFQALRQNKLNPLQSLMGSGQTAANTIGGYVTDGGSAQAAGKVGTANAWGNALSQGVSMYNKQQDRNQNNVFQQALMNQWAKG
jgi:hypothetical protein